MNYEMRRQFLLNSFVVSHAVDAESSEKTHIDATLPVLCHSLSCPQVNHHLLMTTATKTGCRMKRIPIEACDRKSEKLGYRPEKVEKEDSTDNKKKTLPTNVPLSELILFDELISIPPNWEGVNNPFLMDEGRSK